MPLQKHRSLVIAFDSTTQALAAEALCRKEGLPGRIIPLPAEISAGCGLSWKAEPEDRDGIVRALDAAGIVWKGTFVLDI